jgi:predicted nuclease with RNAse H fold
MESRNLAAGIDLSGRTIGTTALALVGGDAPRPEVLEVVAGRNLRGPTGDAEIVRRLEDRRPAVVAVDAPLTLPHAVTCDEPECPICFPADGVAPSYGSRAIDGAAAWAAVGHAEKPPMAMVMVAGIAFRARYLQRLLERVGLTVIETWPMGVYRVLARGAGETAADTGDAWRRGLLASAIDGLDGVDASNTDRLDAVAAAYVGWCHVTRRATAVVGPEGYRDEGEIWVPRSRG